MRCPRTAQQLMRAVARRARRVGLLPTVIVPRQRTAEEPVAPVQPEPVPEPEPEPEPEPVPPTPEELRAAREEQLLQASPQLVRADGRLAEVRDDLLSGDAYLHNFTEVARLLTGAGVRFAPLGGQWTRQWVAIAPGQREAVLTACAEAFEGLPVYADLLGHDVTLGSVLAEELPAAVAALEWPDGLPGSRPTGSPTSRRTISLPQTPPPRPPPRRPMRPRSTSRPSPACGSRGCGSTGR